jgi:hypothetical protein
MFEKGYTHTVPSFSIPNPGPAPYTPGYNGQSYTNPNGNYQAPYTTIAYTDFVDDRFLTDLTQPGLAV